MAFRLAHFSDIHVSAHPSAISWRDLLSKRLLGWVNLRVLGRYGRLRDGDAITRAFVEDVAATRPDHVLFTGDATSLSLADEFSQARRLLEPLLGSGRITGLPGNHDVYVRSAARDRLYELYLGDWERSDLPDAPPIVKLLGDTVALVCVKDSRPNLPHDSSGRVGREQLARLRSVLGLDSLAGRRVILGLHYAPRRADGRPDGWLHRLRDAEELLSVASRGGVDLVVHGHIHSRFVLRRGPSVPVPLANPGSLTISDGAHSYHVYEVDRLGIRLTARRYDAESKRFVSWPEAPGSGWIAGEASDSARFAPRGHG